ncbi:granzyme B-like, partial [Clarias magur]
GMESGIIGGNGAKPHSRPYMVSFQINKKHKCGGMLIRNDYVLTAAHCIDDIGHPGEAKLEVLLGAHNISRNEPQQQRIQVQKYIKHPCYKKKERPNDIMLLKLMSKAKLNNAVKTISLPKKNENIPAQEKCSIAGWGWTQQNSPVSSAVLQEVTLKVQFNFECRKIWEDKFSTDSMICTVSNGKMAFCKGDSGSPLICGNKPEGMAAYNYRENCLNRKYPELKSKAKQNKAVKLIGLPTQNENIPDQKKCSIAGWGWTQKNSTPSSVLQEVTLKIQNNTECKRLWQQYFDTDNMICTAPDGRKAFCQLKSKPKDSKAAKPIDLPAQNENIPDQKKCSIAGWGRTHQNSTASSVLREVTLKIQNNSECKSHWQHHVDTDNMICTASDARKAFCQGDSGSPLICGTKPQGLAAYTPNNCLDPQYPERQWRVALLVESNIADPAKHKLEVLLGAHNISENEPQQQRIQVQEYFKHPCYKKNERLNDIMLLKLKSNAKLIREVVDIIALPKDKENIPAHEKCSIAGWGKTHQNSAESNVLREVKLKIQFNFECKKIWSDYFSTENMICTVSDGKTAFCQ